jgi:hypothetical protein
MTYDEPQHTTEDFLACFLYDPETGALSVHPTILARPGSARARRAYRLNQKQHVMDGRSYSNHHIAWAMHHGVPLPPVIHFKDGDRTNLRADNLLGVVGPQASVRNDPASPHYRPTSIHKNPAVRWDMLARKWRAILNHPTRGFVPVGEFDDETEAVVAVVEAKRVMHLERVQAAIPTTLAHARAKPRPAPTITPSTPLASLPPGARLRLADASSRAAQSPAVPAKPEENYDDIEDYLNSLRTTPPPVPTAPVPTAPKPVPTAPKPPIVLPDGTIDVKELVAQWNDDDDPVPTTPRWDGTFGDPEEEKHRIKQDQAGTPASKQDQNLDFDV